MDGIGELLQAETPQSSTEPSSSDGQPAAKRSNPNLKTPITAENAREMALRSHAKRKERMEELRKAAERPAQEESEYRLFRLTRTREQLLVLDKQLVAETDPKSVKSICDAIARLCDVEQKLAMRPLPGSRRPGREKTERTSSSAGPLDAE